MPDQTQAAVLFSTNQPLRLVDLTLPELQPGQILVDVAYSGVCQSQLLEIRGKRGHDPYLPHTLGHEGTGIVGEVGPGVTKVKSGDRVVLSWIKGAGLEVPKTVYEHTEGPVNSGAISTFMYQAITCENRVTAITADMPLKEAALLGCAIPTGSGIVVNTARIKPGSTVAIIGVGGIGMSAILGASLVSATKIIAIDIHDRKLQQAKSIGATHLINVRQGNPVDVVLELTAGRGVDYAIESAGQVETMEMALDVVREGGGLCVLAGNLPAGKRISIDPFSLIKGKRIIGTWGGETQPDVDIPLYVNLYKAGKFALDKLITHVYPLEEINQAFDALEQGQVGRALVRLGGNMDGQG